MNIRRRIAITTAATTLSLGVAVGSFGFASPSAGAVLERDAVTSANGATVPLLKGNAPKAKISHYKRLTKKAKKVAKKVRNSWSKVRYIGGWRAGSAYSGDHPAGRALDVMIPKWKKNKSLGWSIAKYFAKKKTAKKYKIHYVIFRQKIWTTATPRWRKMANRGGATANHFDHVHISVKR
ncbi:hypothetical protein [Micropruina sonneratiae]|uniref:hypothetical protein n=1 Tax=Micropruina sonneratiae TaxID=2986940 RepID=UPI00222603B0|nr:hypothetical protein [Micropruina sp. KQZ13P-5]MCW3158408.1 hypothetical protein [Micropruina sp. KQZ13P-5]